MPPFLVKRKRRREVEAAAIPSRIRLAADESLVLLYQPNSRMWVYPAMILTLGLYSLWRRVTYIAVTTERVVQCGGVLNTYERSLPLRHVQHATVSRDWQSIAKVEITTASARSSARSESVVFHSLTPRTARELADTVLKLART
jgi:membrane protein YdbS with pleckstrin-like domain